MVGDVGRTELATAPEAGATQLFGTVQRLKEFPDYLEILPGAYAGSVCGRTLSGKPVSTIGFERRFNRAFQISTVEQFIDFMLQSIPAPPPAESTSVPLSFLAGLFLRRSMASVMASHATSAMFANVDANRWPHRSLFVFR
jgi:hypothetical protein